MARGSQDSSGKWVEGPRELVALTTYNGKGNKTEHSRNETISNVPLSGDIPSENKKRLSALAWGKWIYTYDQEGKRVSRTRTRADGALHDRTLYAYDESGNKIEKVTYRADGSVGEKLVHSYNAEGQRIETASFTASRNIIKNRRTVYTYNRQGNPAQAVTSDELGLISKETFLYDPSGRLTEEVLYYPDGSSVKVRSIHTYDAEGNRTSTGVYEAHDPGSVAVLYDRKGNVIENLTYAADGSITPKIVFIYKFDSAGNWIRRSALHCVSK